MTAPAVVLTWEDSRLADLITVQEDATGHGLYRRVGDDIVVTVPELATVRVSRSAPPVVELRDGRSDADVEWLLKGPVWQITRLLEGHIGLRASAVVKNGRAVVFAGDAAVCGRSSTAAALGQRGFAVAGDAFVTWDPETCTVRGDGPEVMLLPDAVTHLGLDAREAHEVRRGGPRRRYSFTGAASATLAAVVVLERSPHGSAELIWLRGYDAAIALRSCLALEPVITLLGLDSSALAWVATLASRSQVLRLRTSQSAWHAIDPVEKLLAGPP